MSLLCTYCKRDLNAMGSEDRSYSPHVVVCEDCAGSGRR